MPFGHMKKSKWHASTPPQGIIHICINAIKHKTIMEAERINSISHRIADLTDRETALRGYL